MMNGDRHVTRAVYVISVAAELAGVHPQTLRIYERKGLLDPARTGGGSRRVQRAGHRPAAPHPGPDHRGLNLEGVRRVIELEAEVAELRAELEQARRRPPRPSSAPTASTGGTSSRSRTRPTAGCPAGRSGSHPKIVTSLSGQLDQRRNSWRLIPTAGRPRPRRRSGPPPSWRQRATTPR